MPEDFYKKAYGDTEMVYECILTRGATWTRVWISDKDAFVGKQVKLSFTDNPDVPWIVDNVGRPMTKKKLEQITNL